MKDKDLLILGGCALGAYLLFGRKATTTTENGGGTLLSSLPMDLSWLSDVIPQNMLPSIDLSTGETGPVDLSNVTDIFQGLFDKILDFGKGKGEGEGEGEGVPPPEPPPEDGDGQRTKTGGAAITGDTSWEEIAKRWLGATTPATANFLTGVGGAAAAASIVGGGIYATKALYPGAQTAFQGLGNRIATFWRRLGIKGPKIGGGMGSAGMGAVLTPGMMAGFETSNLVLELFSQGNILEGLNVFISGPGAFGTPKYPVTEKKVATRTMRAGEAPSIGQIYDAKYYSRQSALSSKKSLGGGQISTQEAGIPPLTPAPAPITTSGYTGAGVAPAKGAARAGKVGK